MPDFPKRIIELKYFVDAWGPFNFDFTDAIPSGLTISAATLKSYLGTVDKGDDLSAETETTSELIDTASVTVTGSTTVDGYFNYPTTATYMSATGEKHTLVFELTLSNAAKQAYYFHFVKVFI